MDELGLLCPPAALASFLWNGAEEESAAAAANAKEEAVAFSVEDFGVEGFDPLLFFSLDVAPTPEAVPD